MNFQADDGGPNIPMLKWEYGYVMFWAISIVMSIALWLFVRQFRRQSTGSN